ncbi:MAG: hypothetical protein U0169_24205 [Polyangiaceae bacterium]
MKRVPAILFGGGNLFSAILVTASAFLTIHEFDAWVHGPALVLAGTSALSGVALLVAPERGRKVARLAATALLVTGVLSVLALVGAIAFLSEVSGPVGTGGVLIFTLLTVLVVPYVVVLPLAQLVWLGRLGEAVPATEVPERR